MFRFSLTSSTLKHILLESGSLSILLVSLKLFQTRTFLFVTKQNVYNKYDLRLLQSVGISPHFVSETTVCCPKHLYEIRSMRNQSIVTNVPILTSDSANFETGEFYSYNLWISKRG